VADYFDRELSWLSFNERVLQEAKDPNNPLAERLKFLAIFSSNLDEFFRVRVASLRTLLRLKSKRRKKLDFDPAELLDRIHATVKRHQEEFGRIYAEEALPQLEERNVRVVREHLSEEQEAFVKDFFLDQALMYVNPRVLSRGAATFFRNQAIYFAVDLSPKGSAIEDGKPGRVRHGVVDIPSKKLPRFVELPDPDGLSVMWLDDVVRRFLPDCFPGYTVGGAYSIKLTRDAELYIDDEFSGDLLAKIKRGLSKRDTGAPSRFLYDGDMPPATLAYLKQALELEDEDAIPGGRYHNYHDLFSFPMPDDPELTFPPSPPHPVGRFEGAEDYFAEIARKDALVHYPYQKYDYVVEFIERAARDERVESIAATLYRVASRSKVVAALVEAAKRGKDVSVFVEIKARFDEESNIISAGEMERAGVKVHYSFPALKVHAKACLVRRREHGELKDYAYLATGNFNEKTSRIYSDFGLFTADERLTADAARVFRILNRESAEETFDHMLVAPFTLRKGLNKLIDGEIDAAKKGKRAWMKLKCNSLEDPKIIKRLYKASSAGVKTEAVVRGICRALPGVKGVSENLEIRSILDKYLEHARIYQFHAGGEDVLYLASADLMRRNLNRRIELCFPIYDPDVMRTLEELMAIQLADNVKARILDQKQKNKYYQTEGEAVRSQFATYAYLAKDI
jgi:polyphosphate kinase